MSGEGEKNSTFPNFRARGDIFKCFALSDRQQTQRYSVSNYKKKKKAPNPHIGEAVQDFCWEIKTQTTN